MTGSELEHSTAALVEALQAALGSRGGVDLDARFRDQGLDSAALLAVAQRVSERLGKAVPVTAFWRFPTPRLLLQALTTQGTGAGQEPSSRKVAQSDEPIAVVGIGCRFPGGVRGPQSFWRLLTEQRSGIRELHGERWDVEELFDPDPSVPGRMTTRWAGLIDGVQEFEPEFFGISEREALEMDPQQRVLLEVAWEAIENAGVAPPALRDRKGGVFVGAMWRDYAQREGEALEEIGPHTATGQDLSIIAGRISYLMGLRGPSMVVNTACSSSLVAVHLAARSLRDGECELALAGAVSLMLSPSSAVAMSKFGAMSPRGECSAFAAEADGYVRGEGAGMLVLKRLSDAARDGDKVYGLIRGSAINNDGYSNGLTAPNPVAQEDVLRAACAAAGVHPGLVDYVETHGPGTVLGDPIEASALGAVFGAERPAERPLAIGSVKTNIGHLEAAAGMAGLIKTLLCLRMRALVGNRNFRTPNPHIDFQALRLRVVTESEPWMPSALRALAGVSSFGFGGTNAHVIVEAATAAAPALASAEARGSTREQSSEAGPDPREMAPAQVVFVFPGQGGQWPHMARELLISEPVFAQKLAACDEILRGQAGWSLLELLTRDFDEAVWNRIDRVQPALFAMQVGYAALWASRGVQPDAVIGHSLGEAAAAHVAGALNLADALRVVLVRSALAQSIAGEGAMLVARLGEREAEAAAAELQLSVAAFNAKNSVVFSGTKAQVAAALAVFEARGARPQRVDVDFASHSPQVDPLLPELARGVESIVARPALIQMFSSVTADELRGPECGPGYWTRNLRQPVRFWQAAARACAVAPTVFVELSPHPVLEHALASSFAERSDVAVVATSARDTGSSEQMMTALATLRERGVAAAAVTRGPLMVNFGTHSEGATGALAQTVAEQIEQSDDATVRSLADQMARVWRHGAQRAAVVGANRDELIARLKSLSMGGAHSGVFSGRRRPGAPRVAFVFPGQGSQWTGMGRELMRSSPAFLSDIRQCDRAIAAYTDWSLEELLQRGLTEREAERIDVVQPVLFGMQIALARQWQRLGVEPALLLGHSMGEVAAACLAGVLSLQEAALVVVTRSQLAQRVAGRGAMAMLELAPARAAARVAPLAPRVCVAAHNGPETTIVAGDRDAVVQLLAELDREGVFARLVRVDFASHSPHVDKLRPLLLDRLASLRPAQAKLPFLSTVDLRFLGGPECDASYWVRNLREPVRFYEATLQAAGAHVDAFIEISPNPVLAPAMAHAARAAEQPFELFCSLRRDEPERSVLLESAAKLWCLGVDVRAADLQGPADRHVDLPLYPWQRRRLWKESCARPSRESSHAGLRRLSTGLTDSSKVWELSLSLEQQPYLADHRVRGAVLMPAAGYLALIWAARQTDGEGAAACALRAVQFVAPLTLHGAGAAQLQVIEHIEGGARVVRVLSRTGSDGEWCEHVRGSVALDCTQRAQGADAPAGLSPLLSVEQRLRAAGLDYGPRFQRLRTVAQQEGWATAELSASAVARGSIEDFTTWLDACLQLGVLALAIDDRCTIVPSAIEGVTLLRAPGQRLSCCAGEARAAGAGRYRVPLITMRDERGELGWLEGVEFTVVEELTSAAPEPSLQWDSLEQAPADLGVSDEPWFVVGERESVASLSRALRELGCTSIECVAEADGSLPELAEALNAGGCAGVVFAWLDHAQRTDQAALRKATLCLQHALQAVTKSDALGRRFSLVTHAGMAAAPGDSVQSAIPAALWSMVRAVDYEVPELAPVCIDIEAADDQRLRELASWLCRGPEADLLALRRAGHRVGRLRADTGRRAGWDLGARVDPGAQLELRCLAPGRLDSLALVQSTRPELGAGLVLVEVSAAGLNFIDLLQALAEIPISADAVREHGFALGCECVGRVAAVGAGVEHVRVGDRVVSLAGGAFAAQVVAPAQLVCRVDAAWSDAELASLPIAFITAYYGLAKVARIERGERVLIHSAAGGVGLAAVQWAQHVGAEVFATAGSPEKRRLLEQLGVAHVFDSRSTRFAEGVLAATGGEGVDVVLNSLSGESLELSLGLLRDHGRFIELGKRDYYADRRIGLRPFLRNITFSLVDLHAIRTARPEKMGALLREVLTLLERGLIRPLPYEVAPLSEASRLFRQMAQGLHTGKLVLQVDAPASAPIADVRALVRAQGSYLVTGGLGALGLRAAHWLATQGATHLVLAGRSAPGEQVAESIAALRKRGLAIEVCQLDVSSAEQIAALSRRFGSEWPRLRGIIHAAGCLADGLLESMDADQLERALAPKAYGALNLVAAFGDADLDFLVFYSSIAAVLGSAGQANYCAANGFLDGLAQVLRARGVPALSINWGPFAEFGLAAASEHRGARMEARGMQTLVLEDADAALSGLLGRDRAQCTIGRLQAQRWIEFYPHLAGHPSWSELGATAAGGSATADLSARLALLDPSARSEQIEELLRSELEAVLRCDARAIEPDMPFRQLGLDSLLSLELRNRLEQATGQRLSTTLLWTYGTLAALTAYFDRTLAAPAPTPAPESGEIALPRELDTLSDAEAEAQLEAELSALEGTL